MVCKALRVKQALRGQLVRKVQEERQASRARQDLREPRVPKVRKGKPRRFKWAL